MEVGMPLVYISLFVSLLFTNPFSDNLGGAIKVTNTAEFLRAIASNATIYLKSGTYDLTEYSTTEEFKDLFRGDALTISGIHDLKIIGDGKENTQIITNQTSAFVMSLVQVTDVELNHITLGHDPDVGYCSGGVIYLERADSVKLKNLHLFGSGVTGLQIYRVEQLDCTNLSISDCSDALLYIDESDTISFRSCQFTTSAPLINITSSEHVAFEYVTIESNHYEEYSEGYLFSIYEAEHIVISDSLIQGNSIRGLSNTFQPIQLIDTIIRDNTFQKQVRMAAIGVFHGDEASIRTGEQWFGIFRNEDRYHGRFVDVSVTYVNDPILDQEGEATGIEISLPQETEQPLLILYDDYGTLDFDSFETAAIEHISSYPSDLIQANPYLQYRPINFILPGDFIRLTLNSNKTYSLCSSGQWTIPFEESEQDSGGFGFYSLHLLDHHYSNAQYLKSQIIYYDGFHIGEGAPYLVWAGDLDGDKKLDLILDTPTHYNVGIAFSLYLSTQANEGELLGYVTGFSSVGC
jgi:hypothetical protein